MFHFCPACSGTPSDVTVDHDAGIVTYPVCGDTRPYEAAPPFVVTGAPGGERPDKRTVTRPGRVEIEDDTADVPEYCVVACVVDTNYRSSPTDRIRIELPVSIRQQLCATDVSLGMCLATPSFRGRRSRCSSCFRHWRFSPLFSSR